MSRNRRRSNTGSRRTDFSYYSAGDTNTTCDRSGQKIKLSEAAYEWNGLLVSKDLWEERQPQDLPKTPRPETVYPNTRAEQDIVEYTPPTQEELSQ